MTCERIKPLLSAAVDNDLTAAERELVESHCRICPACRSERAGHYQTRAHLRSLPLLEPPPGVQRGVRSAVAAIDQRRRWWYAVVRGLTATTAAAAVLLVMLILAQPGGPASVGDRVRELLGPSQAGETTTPVVQPVDAVPTPTATPLPLPSPAPAAAAQARTESPMVPAVTAPPPSAPASGVPTASPTPLPPPTTTTAPPTPTTRPASPPAAPTTAPARPAATATATRVPATPTPTRPPVTATPTTVPTQAPATSTSTGPVVGASFSKVYADSAEVRGRLGAPIQAERGVEGRSQPFEQGTMAWLADDKQIYVLYRDGRTWVRFADTWSPDEVTIPGEPAPPGRYRPQRAFGKVWREHPTVRERLGWGTAPEQTDAARLQRFERGLILTAANGAVQVLYEDGAWQQFERTP